MDPLSVAASITGLLTASIEVAKLFAALAAAYDYVRMVHDEIHYFRLTLFSLARYVQSDSINIARASMIDLDQVVTVLMGCMLTFSELEREFRRLESGPGGLRRVRWAMAKSSMLDLVQRLQNHKGTICSMLLILTSTSQDEALNGMHGLQREVAELVRINAEMARKLESVTAGSTLAVSIPGSAVTTRSVLSFSSVRTNFQTTLNNSRIYRRALLGRANKLKPSPATEQAAPSIQQSWSILSGISLSEVSNYAVYSLPISPQELYNSAWYTNPGQVVTLELTMPGVPTLLATGFAEALRIALEQNDAETAKTIANYVPWGIVLEMSSVYPTLASHDGVIDRLTLFGLWLWCGGDTEAKDQRGQAAIMKAVEDEDWGMFNLLLQNGSDINSTWDSKTALHLVSGGGGESFVLGLWDHIKAKGRPDKRGWAVQALLERGADIHAQDKEGQTALHHASGGGHGGVVEVLLSHGASVGAEDCRKMTALHSASAGGHEDVVEVLLSKGAEIKAKGESGITALHRACKSGHERVVEVLLSRGADIEGRDNQKKTALHFASEGGHERVVEVLLSRGSDINGLCSGGKTVLHSASEGGHERVVEVLLSRGANIHNRDDQKKSALHFASKGGHERVVEVLLSRGASIYNRDDQKKTALHFASEGGHERVVEVLLTHEADIKGCDNQEKTALHFASEGGHERVVEVLLSHGADIEDWDNQRKTALHFASEGGHESVVEVLLSRGADIEGRDDQKKTALHFASEGGHERVVEVLLSHGADINGWDSQVKTALHFASEGGHERVVEVLLSHRADINGWGNQVKTALHFASEGGHERVVEVLVSKGAKINAKWDGGKTALHSACEGGHERVVEVLLSHGADIEGRDNQEKTALHFASEGGHKHVVEVLLSRGADIEVRDRHGRTALYLASRHKDVTELLRGHQTGKINALNAPTRKKP